MLTHLMTDQDRETLFRRWLQEHIGLIYKVVRGCVSAPEDQEDLFQEVLLQLWTSAPAFRGEAKETTWIYRVAFNTALAWRRGQKRHREGWEKFVKFNVSPQMQPSHLDTLPEQAIVERLYAAIHQLPKLDSTLALLLLDGLSYQEMAEIMGISENYIGVKLNRIRKQLAEQLKEAKNEL